MNKIIHNFPKANRLTCIWIETGDPGQPLACVWMDSDPIFINAANPRSPKAEVEGIRLCA
jgi:hypothetical protein